MQQIINFFIRYRNSVLFLFLTIIGVALTVQSRSYHQSKLFNSSKWVSGRLYNVSNSVSSYFQLRAENNRLVEENTRLRKMLFNRSDELAIPVDTAQIQFNVIKGRIIKNSYAATRNYITINLGEEQGVQPDMGVITSEGILGIVENTSKNFATVQSILNSNSNINAKIKNTDYFGSLVWDGNRYDVVQLVDIPRLVPLVIGDTIITGGMSSIFPEDIPIGTIKKYDLNTSKSFYNIDVALFNDMANLKNIYIINNLNKDEILDLQDKTKQGNE
ncbi:MAG: rod shape-determining protein MreC [Allomuricauda sp.]|nr:MAG: rod shape-determining protein MreC [Allomuricauda sp.]